jgi:hypothetical protein
MVSIHCDEQQIQLATSYQLTDFPLKYLEIPLLVRKLDKVTLQPLVDQMEDMLPVLKGRLMHHDSRLVLIKTTLATIPVHLDRITAMAHQRYEQDHDKLPLDRN